MGNKDRDVTHDAHTQVVAAVFQIAPLDEKEILPVLVHLHFVMEFTKTLVQDAWIPLGNLHRPKCPFRPTLRHLDGLKQSIVIQPVRVSIAESKEPIPSPGPSLLAKALVSLSQDGHLCLEDRPVINLV